MVTFTSGALSSVPTTSGHFLILLCTSGVIVATPHSIRVQGLQLAHLWDNGNGFGRVIVQLFYNCALRPRAQYQGCTNCGVIVLATSFGRFGTSATSWKCRWGLYGHPGGLVVVGHVKWGRLYGDQCGGACRGRWCRG